MNGIPKIGGTRGIFEIFVPGMFLLLNLLLIVYLFPFITDDARKQIASWISNPVLSLVILVGFGYLIGVILRMLRTELADKWSRRCLRIFDPAGRKEKQEANLFVYEKFPYIGWLGVVCKRSLPCEVNDFYHKVWAKRKSTSFFNFCKIMIISEDERIANEIYSAEALSRYISGMFYALTIAFCLILVTVVLRSIVFGKIMAELVIVLVAYLLAIFAILKNFRFIRIKESKTVFAASYKYKWLFTEMQEKEPEKESD